MISLIINIIIVCVVTALLYGLINKIDPPEPVGLVCRIVVVSLGLLILLAAIFRFVNIVTWVHYG